MKLIKYFLNFGLFIALMAVPGKTFSQLSIDDHTYSQTQLIQKLAGKGVKISNIQFNCPFGKSKPAPYGYFNDNTGTLGIETGLVMTTGAAVNALGPNDAEGKGQINDHCGNIEEGLSKLLTTEKRLCDACKIEFDITVDAGLLLFNYVFGSEEYLEYKASFHDVFGFFITGPGINGEKNLALLPNSNIPVDVHTVNDNANTKYYINNGTGENPNLNLDLQYDGYTTVLEASSDVIPCQTYHLKLIIADVKDSIYDSGVFLENKSFQSIQSFTTYVTYEHAQFKSAIEGCNKAYAIFKRTTKNNTQPLVINYLIKGSAKNGIDYTTIDSTITIPPGKDSAFVTINAFAEGIKDDNENVQLLIKNTCPNLPPQDTIDVMIKEDFIYKISPKKICVNLSTVLNGAPDKRYNFQWQPSTFLSCLDCPSPVAAPLVTTTFPYIVKDISSGCLAYDSVIVEVMKNPIADFNAVESPLYTSQDIDFKNLSLFSDEYFWDFGDSKTSNENSPSHHYTPLNTQVENTFEVTLISRLRGYTCSDTIVKKITIYPLFFPNLITVNDDGQNEFFLVKGLKPGVWKLGIYNRWGALVYFNAGYDNKWSGQNVSSGVYYYLFESGERKINGWVEVIK